MTTASTRRPAPAPARPYRFPTFDRIRSANGSELLVAPIRELPIVSVVALIDAGATRDPVGQEGLAVLTAKLLLEGTRTRDGAALIDAFEQLGATIDATIDWDAAILRLTVLRSNLDPALTLLDEVLREPGFRERDIVRLKAARQAERLQIRTEPRELADEAFGRFLYAEASRFSRPEAGSSASVAAIETSDIEGFHQAHYVPENLSLILVGDLGRGDAAELMKRTFGKWTGGGETATPVPDATANPGRRVHIIAKPEAPQTELRIGHNGVARMHPDYFRLVLMNAVLGGLFSSRINLNLREKHGYAYGAHSEFQWRRNAGPFVVSTATESGVTADAAGEILGELTRIRESPILPDELSLAVDYLKGVFPIRYETTSAIAAALAALVTYRYPPDYFDTYRNRIGEVTAQDVLDVAKQHLIPDQLLVIAVGDPAVIEPALRKLAIGPITVTTADDFEPGPR
jgi:zinc protease